LEEISASREGYPPNLGARHLIEIFHYEGKGRGLRATDDIPAGTLIEGAPVIVMDAEELLVADRTNIKNYWFHWDGEFMEGGRGAIALGYISCCNHSTNANAYFNQNHASHTMELIALRDIAKGEEVTIDYLVEPWWEHETIDN